MRGVYVCARVRACACVHVCCAYVRVKTFGMEFTQKYCSFRPMALIFIDGLYIYWSPTKVTIKNDSVVSDQVEIHLLTVDGPDKQAKL